MGSPYSNLDRPPLSAARLRRALLGPGTEPGLGTEPGAGTEPGLWTAIEVVERTGSTNADVVAAARAGTAEGLVLLAESQRAGRGRLGRDWQSPPRAGIAASVLLRPGRAVPQRGWAAVPAVRYGWLPLLAGVALVAAVSRVTGLPAALKWPNDLLVAGRKCAGILAESVPGSDTDPGTAVVVGIGLNVSLRADELPTPDATSLVLAGAPQADRDPLVRAVLRELAGWYGRWRATGGDAGACGLVEAYRRDCATLGRAVTVSLPGGGFRTGTAIDVDGDGRLLVKDAEGSTALAAGDVLHLRPSSAGPAT